MLCGSLTALQPKVKQGKLDDPSHGIEHDIVGHRVFASCKESHWSKSHLVKINSTMTPVGG